MFCTKKFEIFLRYMQAQSWNLSDRSMEDFSTTWRKATRLVWHLPHMTRTFLLPELTRLKQGFHGYDMRQKHQTL